MYLQPYDSDAIAVLPDATDVIQLSIRVKINESATEPAETRLDVRICGNSFMMFPCATLIVRCFYIVELCR